MNHTSRTLAALVAIVAVPVPAAAQWSAAASMSTPRMRHGATLLADGRVLVTGGRAEEHTGGALDTAEVYDPELDEWSVVGALTEPRERHTATRIEDGRVLVVGGPTAELFDPATDTFESVAGPTEPRSSHAAAHLGGGRVLVVGGVSHPTVRASAEVFDDDAGTWSFVPSMRVPRWDHRISRLPDGRLFVTGGSAFGEDGTTLQAVTEIFDPGTETWSLAGPMQRGRTAHAAAALPTGEVVLAGGDGGWDETSFEVYDPVRDRFREGDDAPGVGAGHPTASVLESDLVLFTGGERALATRAALYLPWSHTFVSTFSMTAGRTEHTATLLPDGRVLVVGGLGPSGPQPTAEALTLGAVGEACDGAGGCITGTCTDGTCDERPALPDPPLRDGGVAPPDGGPGGGGDAGEPTAPGDGDGCGCVSAGASPRGPGVALALALALALVAVLRRRRRAAPGHRAAGTVRPKGPGSRGVE